MTTPLRRERVEALHRLHALADVPEDAHQVLLHRPRQRLGVELVELVQQHRHDVAAQAPPDGAQRDREVVVGQPVHGLQLAEVRALGGHRLCGGPGVAVVREERVDARAGEPSADDRSVRDGVAHESLDLATQPRPVREGVRRVVREGWVHLSRRRHGCTVTGAAGSSQRTSSDRPEPGGNLSRG
ncbi:hypothetical protein [Aeromicrobium sp. REDSEA-S32_B7]|uniref:hypothetical protein n=1 Tax=Aeromicrobium sp. REDSEA-S32_B7 TaxID=1811526 RepID=UPI000A9DEA12|nr:hypothetical protein [Aeromicrobium sp. REDSEA-S32_B7]